MIELRVATTEEIPVFVEMESAVDASGFINGHSPEKHKSEMEKDGVLYLSILNNGEIAGFFILAIELDSETVEFRRVVIGKKGKGTGQRAIIEMEEYCRSELGGKRIWLDVFESNLRGRHIYEKLGYQMFKKTEANGEPLLFYEKKI